ncbi:L-ascorbate metabolism protein UlaG (beta-lactamase superfamily) [Actinoplanes campanulatus]|uniref:L-ascorbate metabolism protein UlaG (Beta-lactamase superfamily) n=1 Tax=Actinoplanes campanulatus TaxID=113559 RepID=A0A7W5FD83_9ACTN|nr:MBL fold metallo-hydrolase [Actinoplanes campanulatus]MBB3094045.1 L-ascorbate metabolism protein UlaG (beta-lactamase superfamily) [Actinoplanes campanulatus]GGN33110.1 MBL fold metallo-hydrolase [Actinoplanes campanulatus]GID38257.1 MBL fold metallo-hydrolase [Actinoplanes campanulatus]
MQLTKHAHACVTLTGCDGTLLIDPGTFTPDAAELIAAATAVLVTHEHFDHFDEAALAAELDRRPELRVHGPAAVRERLGGRAVTVRSGDLLEVAGFQVAVHGERHALIHEDIPPVDNVGYLIEGRVFHPGDSYRVPEARVETLLLPTSGPWTKFGEAAEFVRAVHPARMIQVHELMLSELGQNSARMLLGEKGLTGLPLEILPAGESTDV